MQRPLRPWAERRTAKTAMSYMNNPSGGVYSKSRIVKERSALVERADDLRRPNEIGRLRRANLAGLEFRFGSGLWAWPGRVQNGE
jgi:hypothetical protein